tara:strand:+ start:1249 stop:1461 length:213 start_codon:yes stop_codon:yes gene_type:complete
MTDGLKASQIKGGIRPSKSFDQGRVCKEESCKTQLSIYNKREHCFNHAPVKYPKLEEEFFKKLHKLNYSI